MSTSQTQPLPQRLSLIGLYFSRAAPVFQSFASGNERCVSPCWQWQNSPNSYIALPSSLKTRSSSLFWVHLSFLAFVKYNNRKQNHGFAALHLKTAAHAAHAAHHVPYKVLQELMYWHRFYYHRKQSLVTLASNTPLSPPPSRTEADPIYFSAFFIFFMTISASFHFFEVGNNHDVSGGLRQQVQSGVTGTCSGRPAVEWFCHCVIMEFFHKPGLWRSFTQGGFLI